MYSIGPIPILIGYSRLDRKDRQLSVFSNEHPVGNWIGCDISSGRVRGTTMVSVGLAAIAVALELLFDGIVEKEDDEADLLSDTMELSSCLFLL